MYLFILIHVLLHKYSSSQDQLVTPAPEQSLLGVMGVSDWDFLRPPPPSAAATVTTPTQDAEGGVGGKGGELRQEEREEDTTKRPSLDDFDGEIAVFQVQSSIYSLFPAIFRITAVTIKFFIICYIPLTVHG